MKIPLSTLMCFATCAWISSVVCLHISLCKRQHPKCKQFSSCIDLSLVKFTLHPTRPIKIQQAQSTRFKQLYLSNHSGLAICSYELLFKQWPILSPPKTTTFPPESPCIWNTYTSNFFEISWLLFTASKKLLEYWHFCAHIC